MVAAQMAVDDFKGKVLGRTLQIVAGDHQNKADVGSAIARRWLENEGVEAILDRDLLRVYTIFRGLLGQPMMVAEF